MMISKRLLMLLLIIICWFFNATFAYPKLSESNHRFIDKSLNLYHNISKELKKEKSELYSKVANDAKILRNAYL
jgi:hypothetical protein